MNEVSKKLLDAHVEYFMGKLSNENLTQTIGEETKIIYRWFSEQTFHDIFTKERADEFGKRLLSEAKVSDATKKYFETLIKDVLSDTAKEGLEIDDLISKDTYDRIIEKGVEQRELRKELIHRLTTNKVYGEMLSEIIYNSIKSFTQQNPFKGSDKGVGGLFNVGRGLIGAALSGVEDSIDKNVKSFLSSNINKTLRDSEDIIQKRLTDENIRKVANKVWNKLDDMNFKEVAEKAQKVTSDGKDSIPDLVSTVLLEVKDSKAFDHISHFILDHFYKTYGEQKFSVLFQELSITEDVVVRESIHFAEDFIWQMNKTGFLEARVREHLKGFYESESAQNILK